jgi:hypothetical protein
MSNKDIALLFTAMLILAAFLLWAAIYLIDNYMLAASDCLPYAAAFISMWMTKIA